MKAVRDDILSWVTDDNIDQQRCFNLLQEMALVDETENYSPEDFVTDTTTCPMAPDTQLKTYKQALQSTKNPIAVPTADQEQVRQTTAWGPNFGTRMSTRTNNGGKTILEIAQDTKKRKNLEISKSNHPARGKKNTPCSNPFAPLFDPKLVDLASQIGICLDCPDPVDYPDKCNFTAVDTGQSITPSSGDSPSSFELSKIQHNFSFSPPIHSVLAQKELVDSSCVLTSFQPNFNSSPVLAQENVLSPRTPFLGAEGAYNFLDSEEKWINVCRIRRGKHPKKRQSP